MVVESLICAQNWFRSSFHLIDIEEKFEKIQEFEKCTLYLIHVFCSII
ncbi:hypothetical protein LINPERHAP2_LOCUS34459 [Linum perenne]